jgi:hypothetical protein
MRNPTPVGSMSVLAMFRQQPHSFRFADNSSAVVRAAAQDDQIGYHGVCTIALVRRSRELQVQGIDLLETRVMQQQGRIVRGQPRPLTELPFHQSTGETHDPHTFYLMVADPHTIKGRAVLHEIEKVYVFAASRQRRVVNTLREKRLPPLLGRERIHQQLL